MKARCHGLQPGLQVWLQIKGTKLYKGSRLEVGAGCDAAREAESIAHAATVEPFVWYTPASSSVSRFSLPVCECLVIWRTWFAAEVCLFDRLDRGHQPALLSPQNTHEDTL